MDLESYEYTGMMAAAWDLLRDDTSTWEDRFFYCDLILRHGQPALDVGCGTGRLLLDYLAQGIDIDGVDISPEMLAICALHVYQEAGFISIQILKEFSQEPASPNDTVFSILGTRP